MQSYEKWTKNRLPSREFWYIFENISQNIFVAKTINWKDSAHRSLTQKNKEFVNGGVGMWYWLILEWGKKSSSLEES